MSKMVQIRNVPDALHRKPKVRAADSGQTLSDYLMATSGRATHARRDADANPQSKARDVEDAGRGGHPGGARVGVIVVDASALLAGAVPASQVSPRDGQHDVRYRPTLVGVTFEPWCPGLPIR
jgi:hypothetical protein